MTSSSSLLPPRPTHLFQPAWSLSLGAGLSGLALAREAGLVLAWDKPGNVYLVNRRGERQAHRPLGFPIAAACIADDGSACVAAGSRGEVCWLSPDLTVCWQKALPNPALAAALDSFGNYLAVADSRGGLHFLDRHERRLASTETARPLHHVAFVPAAPFLLGCADFGLVGCFDPAGKCVWRAGLVAHAGALAVSGDGSVIGLACFTEGLQRYNLAGQSLGRWHVAEPCRLAAVSFDGAWTLTAGLGRRLLLLDSSGKIVTSHELEQPAVGLALSALGESAFAALADGRVVCLTLQEPPGPARG